MAEVSSATISLALRNDPRISEIVRVKVGRLAKELGYQPNPIISQLLSRIRSSRTTSRQGTLGMLYTAQHSEDPSAPAVRSWAKAARARADELGFWLDELHLHEKDMSVPRLLKLLHARNIRGLLVTGPFLNNCIAPELGALWERSATVVLGERPSSPALSCVMNNQFLTVMEAMRTLTSLGYHRPGLCVHPDVDEVVEHWFLGGYLAAQRRLSSKDRIPDFPYQLGARLKFKKWFEHHRPDVILTLHSEIREWTEALGQRVPQDVGLVHLDWTQRLENWSGMRQDHEHLGIAGVEMLVNLLYNNQMGVPSFQQCSLLGSHWVAGKTTIS